MGVPVGVGVGLGTGVDVGSCAIATAWIGAGEGVVALMGLPYLHHIPATNKTANSKPVSHQGICLLRFRHRGVPQKGQISSCSDTGMPQPGHMRLPSGPRRARSFRFAPHILLRVCLPTFPALCSPPTYGC